MLRAIRSTETIALSRAKLKLSPLKWLAGLVLAGALIWPIAAKVREHRDVESAAKAARAAIVSGRFRDAAAPLRALLEGSA